MAVAGGDAVGWSRAHGVDARSLRAWRMNLDRRGTGRSQALRATGRFGWPLAYVVTITAVLLIGRLPARSRMVALASGTLLQLIDVVPAPEHVEAASMPDIAFLAPAAERYDRLEVLPPACLGIDCAGSDARDGVRDGLPSWVAAKMGWSVNAGYAARPRKRFLVAYCDGLPDEMARGPRAATVYLLPHNAVIDDDRLLCGPTPIGILCVDARNEDPLTKILRSNDRHR
ncbi:MAG: hypothetical protein FJ137_05775 [Deltaproteobacteria bacterium]|nr:hypothetical protein [Deltaproteobacteria bacterium]